jgi:hypothetical protein
MRKLVLQIPSTLILEMATKISESNLENSIVGATDDDEVEVELTYSKEDEDAATEIETFLSELVDENED